MNRHQSLLALRQQLVDRMHRIFELDDDDGSMTPVLARLPEIQDALRLADEGRYGSCIDCNELIPLARLRVKPEATRCVQCQESHDSAGARHGGHRHDYRVRLASG